MHFTGTLFHQHTKQLPFLKMAHSTQGASVADFDDTHIWCQEIQDKISFYEGLSDKWRGQYRERLRFHLLQMTRQDVTSNNGWDIIWNFTELNVIDVVGYLLAQKKTHTISSRDMIRNALKLRGQRRVFDIISDPRKNAAVLGSLLKSGSNEAPLFPAPDRLMQDHTIPLTRITLKTRVYHWSWGYYPTTYGLHRLEAAVNVSHRMPLPSKRVAPPEEARDFKRTKNASSESSTQEQKVISSNLASEAPIMPSQSSPQEQQHATPFEHSNASSPLSSTSKPLSISSAEIRKPIELQHGTDSTTSLEKRESLSSNPPVQRLGFIELLPRIQTTTLVEERKLTASDPPTKTGQPIKPKQLTQSMKSKEGQSSSPSRPLSDSPDGVTSKYRTETKRLRGKIDALVKRKAENKVRIEENIAQTVRRMVNDNQIEESEADKIRTGAYEAAAETNWSHFEKASHMATQAILEMADAAQTVRARRDIRRELESHYDFAGFDEDDMDEIFMEN